MRRAALWALMILAPACAPQALPSPEHFLGGADSAVEVAAGGDAAADAADAGVAAIDGVGDSDAVADVDAVVDTDAVADVDTVVDTDAVADVDAVVDTDAVADVDAGADVEAGADVDAVAGLDVVVDADATADADALADADSSTDVASDLGGDATPGCSAEAALCNGLDEDCDGQTDEGCQCLSAAYLAPDCTACADGFEAIPTAKGQACAADFPVWGARPDSPPSGWFGDNGDGTVSDSHTKLRWQKDFSPAGQTWDAAQKYCFGLTVGGFADWRMPTVAELVTLRDLSKAAPAIAGAFAGTPSDFFWTAMPLQLSPAEAWSVFFSAGMTTAAEKTSPFYVRCVR